MVANYACVFVAAFLLITAVNPPFARSQVAIKREDALDNPSKHAWDLFMIVNHPAKDPKQGRGLPDLTKKIGDTGTTSVWETWRLSETEVFLAGGKRPPAWDDLSLPGGPTQGKVPLRPKFLILEEFAKTKSPSDKRQQELIVMFDPNDGIFQGNGGFGESRMSKSTYEFIVKMELYSKKGLTAYAKDYTAGKKPAISFPVDSMEAKAAWVELKEENSRKRYYVAEYKGKYYGLVGLHIITKDIPNWFWCSFHHTNPLPAGMEPGAQIPDTYGMPQELKGTVWENYRLSGAQIDFTTPIGTPVLLSDPYVEKGFVKSSCITCHARATFAPSGGALGPKPIVGVPNPDEFLKGGKPFMLQTDFLFSIPFRAK